ncbi:hypothetical protein B0I35DRAFT_275686 [Stachybotrys elegans]|uniref:Pal1 cell morphology protein n=1 Tax=Stachybotrys elegans TaxID=80388 RepID=A0A8K0SS41_9HYPO|nr:hypothetical protein B0I35DRAFT_275686 [Stachybotrys elegans]
MGSNKHWARQYILDPLTAPEPSQETGPGTSHYNPLHHSQSADDKRRSFRETTRQTPRKDHSIDPFADPWSGYPTPPSSASPTTTTFHPSNPFSSAYRPSSSAEEPSKPPSSSRAASKSRAREPRRSPSRSRYPPNSYRTPQPQPQSQYLRPERRNSLTARDVNRLRERFSGDMSHQPLEILKREHRAADRLRRPRKVSETDIIDSLDTIGGTYHHGGPYDATLASRNLNKKYSPVAAVQESNMEAIRATPREYIDDSLQRHVPLQGVALVPPGTAEPGRGAFNGRVMNYREGDDLMRDADAPGGAYKRWEGLTYHPDDLKGKSEPAYTFERKAKEKKYARANEYEMQSGVNGDGYLGPAPGLGRVGRQRSHSNTDASSSANAYSSNSGLQRSNTTGKKLGEGLKRRFGSLRKKKDSPTVHVREV